MKLKILLVAGALIILSGNGGVIAQDQESEEPEIFPVEIYACNYNEGKGPTDLDAWSAKWNSWADSTAPEPYSAWTLTPFYYGSEQDFDFLWLGVSPNAAALGRAYDNYLVNSGSLRLEFASMATCNTHGNFATLNFKQPPEDGDSTSFVLGFSDCKITEGKSFDDDIDPALRAWSEYRTSQGSRAGLWVMWPAYGGGGVKFDFKFAFSHSNLESLGIDYDQYSKEGYVKAEELFSGLLDCDDARVYNASQRRDGIPDDN